MAEKESRLLPVFRREEIEWTSRSKKKGDRELSPSAPRISIPKRFLERGKGKKDTAFRPLSRIARKRKKNSLFYSGRRRDGYLVTMGAFSIGRGGEKRKS